MTTLEFSCQYEQVVDRMLAFALKLTRNEEAARDLVQDTALQAFKNRQKFEAGTNFKAWINTILRNTFINQYRKSRSFGKDAPCVSVEENLYWLENKAGGADAASDLHFNELRSVLDHLDETFRVPFLMFYRGFSYEEIAEKVQLPMGTVKSRIFYARKKIKEKLNATDLV